MINNLNDKTPKLEHDIIMGILSSNIINRWKNIHTIHEVEQKGFIIAIIMHPFKCLMQVMSNAT